MSTKEAMLHDWGSRDQKFIDLNQSIRDSLITLIDGENNYQCVPMQGSGTFAVESMISSLTPKDAHILILVNGAYGKRMKKMCAYLNRNTIEYEVAEHEPHDMKKIEEIIDPLQYYVKVSYMITYILLLTTATITFIEAITTSSAGYTFSLP